MSNPLKNQHKLVKELLLLILVLGLSACNDLIEKAITEEQPVLISPTDSSISSTQTQYFWWDYMEDATNYNIKIIQLRNDQWFRLIVDSFTTENTFTYQLFPDTFLWSVQAYNNSSVSMVSEHTLVIQSEVDLSGNIVLINSPQDELATNITDINFDWDELLGTDYYKIEVKSPDWDGTMVINPTLVDTTGYKLELVEGKYVWSLQATNEYSFSQVQKYSFIIDLSSPVAPTGLIPAEGDSLYLDETSISMYWQQDQDSGSEVLDSIYISDDSTMLNILVSSLSADESFLYTGANAGIHFWYVKSFDKAGNVGVSSDTIMFTINDAK